MCMKNLPRSGQTQIGRAHRPFHPNAHTQTKQQAIFRYDSSSTAIMMQSDINIDDNLPQSAPGLR